MEWEQERSRSSHCWIDADGLIQFAKTKNHVTLQKAQSGKTRERPTYQIGLGSACSRARAGGSCACLTRKQTQRHCARLRQNLHYHSVCQGGEEEKGQHIKWQREKTPPSCPGNLKGSRRREQNTNLLAKN